MDASAFPLQIGSLLVAGLLIVAWFRARRSVSVRPERVRPALDCAARLIALVAEVQQHRGMSGAWLAGDASFGTRLPARQAAVDRLFAALLEDAGREDGERHPCFTSNDAKLLRHRWRELVDGLQAGTPEQSFQAHCRIVSTLLEWLGAIGEARIEQPLAGLVPPAVGRNFAHRLPALAECLGQARALGSAVAAKGHCPPVSRVRLAFLVSRAEFLLGQAISGAGGEAQAAGDARRAVSTFVEAVRHRLLADAVGISAGECFTLATRAVDGVFGWIAQECRMLEAALPGVSRVGRMPRKWGREAARPSAPPRRIPPTPIGPAAGRAAGGSAPARLPPPASAPARGRA